MRLLRRCSFATTKLLNCSQFHQTAFVSTEMPFRRLLDNWVQLYEMPKAARGQDFTKRAGGAQLNLA